MNYIIQAEYIYCNFTHGNRYFFEVVPCSKSHILKTMTSTGFFNKNQTASGEFKFFRIGALRAGTENKDLSTISKNYRYLPEGKQETLAAYAMKTCMQTPKKASTRQAQFTTEIRVNNFSSYYVAL